MYAEVVFPLPFRNSFSYSVPEELAESIAVGKRVVVPFGKRVLTGFVTGINDNIKEQDNIKPVTDVIDEIPVFDQSVMPFYQWIADYYLCSLGEVMRNSVPHGTEIESKRIIISDMEYCSELLNDSSLKPGLKKSLLEVLSQKENHTIASLQKKVNRKNIYSPLQKLKKEGAVSILDEIMDPKVKEKKQKYVELLVNPEIVFEMLPEIEKSSQAQLKIMLELVSLKARGALLADLLKKTGSSKSPVDSLEKKGLIKIIDKEIERRPEELYSEKKKTFALTDGQKGIIDTVSEKIEKNEFEVFLLHGVTGSGKTQVYIELASKALDKGKTALILVPEISLTPQITSRFFQRFEDKTAVFHSRLSAGERFDTWKGIIAGKYKIVIGPRSALFTPLRNIGLIVVDEEHDGSYKQFEQTPKFHARDSAVVLAKLSDAPVLLGSATPSVESMYNAEKGKYKLLNLPDRVDNAKMPVIELVDVRTERQKKRMKNIFSKRLLDTINAKLKAEEGIIILQNRRGFSTQIYCEDCGEIEMCPNCSVAMVYHINQDILQCHYCGTVKKSPKACSVCGSISLKYFGTGTQRVEDEMEYYFPDAKIARIDSDTIGKKGRLSTLLNNFRKGEYDILVGTQMVSKGLDFSHVTLVGVISAETTLWLPDFRADERTFQLLTQVAGRAGRSQNPGLVLIQTQDKSNFVLQNVLKNDYKLFYDRELSLREQGGYPPFAKLCLIEMKDEEEAVALRAATRFYEILKEQKIKLFVTPPAPAIIARIKNQYRYQIMIKSMRNDDPSGRMLRKAVFDTMIEYKKKEKSKDARMIVDIDPHNII